MRYLTSECIRYSHLGIRAEGVSTTEYPRHKLPAIVKKTRGHRDTKALISGQKPTCVTPFIANLAKPYFPETLRVLADEERHDNAKERTRQQQEKKASFNLRSICERSHRPQTGKLKVRYTGKRSNTYENEHIESITIEEKSYSVRC